MFEGTGNAIVTAMEVELQAYLNLAPWTQIELKGLNFPVYRYKSNILALLGIGPIAASISTTKLISLFNPGKIILSGVGGSLDSKIKSGDVVFGEKLVQHDCIYSKEDQSIELMAPGERHITSSNRGSTELACDTSCIPQHEGINTGLILSGNEFVGSIERKKNLKERFPEALLVEMESIGVKMASGNIPFSLVKAAADCFMPEDSMELSYVGSLEDAAKVSAKTVFDIFVH